MALSSDLITAFAKITNDSKKDKKKEATVYGTVKKVGDKLYVQLDGSELLTPVDTVANMEDNERAIVQIKDHTATIIGNVTSPSARTGDVKVISDEIIKVNQVVANKVDVATLDAEVARIDELIAGKAEIGELDAKYATISQLEAYEANIEKLETDKLDASEADITFAKVEELNAMTADIENLKTDKLDAKTAEINYAKIEDLNAATADIEELNTKKLDAESAKVLYANIDFSNIGEAAVEKLFGDSGIIKDLIMQDGKVTGELVGVTIKGDLIEGNTLKADKLVILGEDGLYYKLNIDALGEATASSDEKYQNGLDGSAIIAKSITADRIAVTDLVAFGATIGGYHITDHALYSGVKSSVDNTTQGVYLGDDGQIAIGDANNFLKFFVETVTDEEGNTTDNYKLEIQASSIKFGTEGDNVADIINKLDTEIDNANTSLSTKIDDVNNNLQQTITELKTAVDANFLQTKEGFEMNFTELIQRITNVDGTVNANYEELVKYIRFNGGTITLGEVGNPLQLELSNNRMSFKQNGTEVAYVSDNKLYIYDGEFLHSLKVGRWAFIIETDGGLSISWV